MKIEIPVIAFNGKIPKLIHQTYYTFSLPAELQRNVDTIKNLNPDWEYNFYSDQDIQEFISKNYGMNILKLFNSINPSYGAARADLFRYLLMYKVGGVYLDIKSCTELPLSQVINENDSFIISQWRDNEGDAHKGWGFHRDLKDIEGGEFQQWHIISSPGHPYLLSVINLVLNNIKNYCYEKSRAGRIGVLRTTGPIAYTKAIAPILNSHPHLRVENETFLGLKYSIVEKNGAQGHNKFFRNHYTGNLKPVVLRQFPRNFINYIFYIINFIYLKLK